MALDILDILGDKSGTSTKSIVGTLFGTSPDVLASQIGQQNLANTQQTAMAYAQMDPMQRAQYAMFQGAAGGTGGLLQAVGAENPQITRAKQSAALQQQISQLPLDTVEGQKQAMDIALQAGRPEIAIQLRDVFLKQGKTQADIEKARRVDPDEAAKAFRQTQLINQYGPEKGYALYQEEEQRKKLQEKAAGRTVVSVTTQQESEFSKELGKIQGKQMESAYNTRNAAVKTLDTLTKMSSLNDQQLISGSFSGPRAATANFLNTLGLASDQDAKRLSNTQQFEKVAGDLVLSNIKQLGYNPSNADVVFLNKTLPNLETSSQARKALIDWMGTKAQGSITEVKNMEQYALKNKSLNGYTPAVPNFNPSGGSQAPSKTYKGKALSEMTPAELAAAKAELSK